MNQLSKSLATFALIAATLAPAVSRSAPACSTVFMDKGSLVQEWLASTKKHDRNPLLMKVFDLHERWLLRKLDPVLLKNDLYREKLVRDLVDVEIRRGLSPLGDYEFSLNRKDSKELRRLAMRSLLQNGLNDYVSSNESRPKFLARVKRVANVIRWNPVFQTFIELRLPLKTVTLTEAQVERVLLGGIEAIERDPQLEPLRKSAKIRDHARAVNDGLRRMVYAGVIIYFYLNFSVEESEGKTNATTVTDDKSDGPIDGNGSGIVEGALVEEVDGDKTVTEIGGLEQTTTVDTDGALLVLARAEVTTLVSEYEERMGKAPSASELEAMKRHVCVQKYGASLGQAGMSKCLAK